MIAVVILAGGKGRRMGGNKALRLLAGTCLIEYALDIAQRWSPRVALSVKGATVTFDRFGVPQLADQEESGPIAGIAAALSFARTEGVNHVLTIPCDTPFLPLDLHDRLSDALSRSGRAAIASSGGRLHPSCALWDADTSLALPDFLASGRGSLRGFAETVCASVVEWPIEPHDPFFNINSEADLAVAEAMIRN